MRRLFAIIFLLLPVLAMGQNLTAVESLEVWTDAARLCYQVEHFIGDYFACAFVSDDSDHLTVLIIDMDTAGDITLIDSHEYTGFSGLKDNGNIGLVVCGDAADSTLMVGFCDKSTDPDEGWVGVIEVDGNGTLAHKFADSLMVNLNSSRQQMLERLPGTDFYATLDYCEAGVQFHCNTITWRADTLGNIDVADTGRDDYIATAFDYVGGGIFAGGGGGNNTLDDFVLYTWKVTTATGEMDDAAYTDTHTFDPPQNSRYQGMKALRNVYVGGDTVYCLVSTTTNADRDENRIMIIAIDTTDGGIGHTSYFSDISGQSYATSPVALEILEDGRRDSIIVAEVHTHNSGAYTWEIRSRTIDATDYTISFSQDSISCFEAGEAFMGPGLAKHPDGAAILTVGLGPDGDAQAKSFTVDLPPVGGAYQTSSSLKLNDDVGAYASICNIGDSDYYAVVCEGVDGDGYLYVVGLNSSGVLSAVDTLEFQPYECNNPVVISGGDGEDFVSIAYFDVNSDIIIETIGVGESDGIITGDIDSIMVVDLANDGQLAWSNMRTSGYYALFASWANTQGHWYVAEISSAGDITNTIHDSDQFAAVSYSDNQIMGTYMTDSVYVAAGYGDGTDGFLYTMKDSAGMKINNTTFDSEEFETNNSYNQAIVYPDMSGHENVFVFHRSTGLELTVVAVDTTTATCTVGNNGQISSDIDGGPASDWVRDSCDSAIVVIWFDASHDLHIRPIYADWSDGSISVTDFPDSEVTTGTSHGNAQIIWANGDYYIATVPISADTYVYAFELNTDQEWESRGSSGSGWSSTFAGIGSPTSVIGVEDPTSVMGVE